MARFYIEYETSFRGRDVNNEALLICPFLIWPRKATIKIIGDMFIGKRTIYSRRRYLVNASFLSFSFLLYPVPVFLIKLHAVRSDSNESFSRTWKTSSRGTNLKKKKKEKFLPIRVFITLKLFSIRSIGANWQYFWCNSNIEID